MNPLERFNIWLLIAVILIGLFVFIELVLFILDWIQGDVADMVVMLVIIVAVGFVLYQRIREG